MSYSEENRRTIYSALDGGATSETCGWGDCGGRSVGTFAIFDDETGEELSAVNFCDMHARQFATAYTPYQVPEKPDTK